MSFLPEEDQEFLDGNAIKYELLAEQTPEGQIRRGVCFPDFVFAGSLCASKDGGLAPVTTCDLVILVPDQYATTRLDSFYTIPHLRRPDGADPENATGSNLLFGRTWQFWSRHLDAADWRPGIDGFRTFLSYVRGEFRRA